MSNNIKNVSRKAILAFALMLSCQPVAYAQNEIKATIAAIDTIVRINGISHKTAVNGFVEELWKKNKENAELAVGIAKAYYHYYKLPNNPYWSFYTTDSLNAYKYIERAIRKDPLYMTAYIRGGEILLANNYAEGKDTAKALQWFERGIKANPSSPDCYIAYAKTLLEHKDTIGSLRKLREINAVVPSYPANLAMARVCKEVFENWTNNDIPFDGGSARWFDFQRNLYAQTDIQQLDSVDYFDYAFSLFTNAEYDKAYEIAQKGMALYPNNINILKVALYSSSQGKKHDEAMALADKLFSISDTIRFHSLDYINAAIAYQAKHNMKKAAEMYHKAYELWDENLRNSVPGTKFGEGDKYMSTVVNMYADDGLYEDAIAENKRWIEMNKRLDRISEKPYTSLAKLYKNFALESVGEDKTRLFLSADSAYAQLALVSKQNKMYAYYNRMVLANAELDPKMGTNNAVTFAEEIENTYKNFGEEEKNESQNIYIYVDACRILCSYYVNTGTRGSYYCSSALSKAKYYCKQILTLFPDDEDTKKYLKILNSVKNVIKC